MFGSLNFFTFDMKVNVINMFLHIYMNYVLDRFRVDIKRARHFLNDFKMSREHSRKTYFLILEKVTYQRLV